MRRGLARLAVAACAAAALPGALASGDDAPRERALTHHLAGREALAASQGERAVLELREAVRLDPLLGAAQFDLGRALMATRSYPEAVRAFLGARDAFRRAAERERHARAQAELRDKVAPLDDVDYHQLDHDRRYPWAYVFEPGRTRSLDIPKDRQAVPHSDVPAEVFAALGTAHLRCGHLEAAEQAYREALRIDPGLGETHNNLAFVCTSTGRLEEADKELDAAERAGFAVNPRFKAELRERQAAAKR